MTQVFLPCKNFTKSAQCLDNRRLPKNMVEAMQVYSYNVYGTSRQGNPHPYEMWRGYEKQLLLYVIIMYEEWMDRLENNFRGGVLKHKSGEYAVQEMEQFTDFAWARIEDPDWWGNEDIFSAYRAALLYKDCTWYGKFGWTESPAIPVKVDAKGNVTMPYVYGKGKDNDE